MKTVKSSARRSRAKSSAGPKTLEEYMRSVPAPARTAFNHLRAAVGSAVPPDSTEIISYGIPAIKSNGVVLIWFAAFSKHCSLFPTSAVIAAFKKELQGFSTSKGTIHFPIDKPLPTSLIKKIVKARGAQTQGRKRA
jgi:uncharacterized protein YdhG (YjbR/CyaY superfamily)